MIFSAAEPSRRGSLLQLIGFFLGAIALLFPESKVTSLSKVAVSKRLTGIICMTFRVLDQFPFEFYGEHFSIALASDRKLYIPMAALCQAMGLQTHGQVTHIRDNEAVAEALATLPMLWAYGDELREREMVCLRLDRLPFWMGTIQP